MADAFHGSEGGRIGDSAVIMAVVHDLYDKFDSAVSIHWEDEIFNAGLMGGKGTGGSDKFSVDIYSACGEDLRKIEGISARICIQCQPVSACAVGRSILVEIGKTEILSDIDGFGSAVGKFLPG